MKTDNTELTGRTRSCCCVLMEEKLVVMLEALQICACVPLGRGRMEIRGNIRRKGLGS